MNEHAYHRNDLIFWSDVQFQVINVAHFNGSNLRALISTGITVPGIIILCHTMMPLLSSYFLSFWIDGLAWDWVNRKLYWTDAGDKDIEVYDVVNQYRKKLIQKGPNALPRAIVLDPANK